MSYFVGAPLRAGFSSHTQEGLYRGSFINRAIPYNPYRHISQQFVALVDALSSETMPRSKVAPLLPPARGASALGGLAVPFAPAELAQYQARLLAAHPTLEGRQRVLVYAGGGLLPERAWPEAHYTALVRGLCEAGHAVGLIGLADDRALASRIHAGVGSAQCADLTGYTGSIRELLMLFHSAQLLVTNDGGPGHFASLTPIEVFMFFGPETSRLYGPLGTVCAKPPTVFDLQWPCSPCLSAYNHRQTFCDGDNQCLKQIAPHTVLALALTALAAPAQGAGA
jgi:ADP-heptose:LPS heptosyltransferase